MVLISSCSPKLCDLNCVYSSIPVFAVVFQYLPVVFQRHVMTSTPKLSEEHLGPQMIQSSVCDAQHPPQSSVCDAQHPPQSSVCDAQHPPQSSVCDAQHQVLPNMSSPGGSKSYFNREGFSNCKEGFINSIYLWLQFSPFELSHPYYKMFTAGMGWA